jgi:Putative peptidoglycan binding domain
LRPSVSAANDAERRNSPVSKISGLPCLCLTVIAVIGCTPLGARPGIERADDLGLQTAPTDVQQLPPLPPLPLLSAPEARDRFYRDGFVEQWMARSDLLCREYKDKIILVSRNTKFATDATSTILSGLATIFTAVGTIHPLTGAATIVSGVGAAAQTDTFGQQSGEIIASAIQTARENQANQIEFNLLHQDTNQYNIYRAQRDVIGYHSMCSLETALAQVRASLKATSPDQGQTPPAAQALPLAEPIAPPPLANPPPQPNPPPPNPPPPPPPHVATGPPKRLLPPQVEIIGATSLAEKSMTPEEGRRVQAALCVPPDPGAVKFGPQTRAAIDMFRTTGGHQGPTGGLTQREIIFLTDRKLAPCDTTQFANVFEYYRYRTDDHETSASKIKGLQAQLRSKGKDVPDTGQFDPATRKAIGELQEANGMKPIGQVTRDFLGLLHNVSPAQ